LVVEMLSIGKLGAGQADYYLDQAEGRVDVAEPRRREDARGGCRPVP
jgi:hypothetical protein